MKNLEDRGWDTLLERLELEMSDADLATADRKLWDLPDDDVVDVRPEWVEATVAKAMAPVVSHDAAASSSGWFRRMQRIAAAVIGFFTLHGTAAAATVVVTVATVVGVSMLWPRMERSSATMPYELAIQVLMSETEPPVAKQSAMGQVNHRVRRYLEFLQRTQEASLPGTPWFEACAVHIAELRLLLASAPTSLPSAVADDFDACYAVAESGSLDGLRRMAELAKRGVLSMMMMQAATAEVAVDRNRYLARWRRLVGS